MSMSGAQVAAFNAASGITPQASTVLFVGTVIALSTLWGAWALYSIYRPEHRQKHRSRVDRPGHRPAADSFRTRSQLAKELTDV